MKREVRYKDIADALSDYASSRDASVRFNGLWYIFKELEGMGLIILDEWVERRVRSWCEDDLVVWWGPASSGKTKVGGYLVLLDWVSRYWCTNSMVVSTTREMLAERIWGEVVNLWLALVREGLGVGDLVMSEMRIRAREGDSRSVLRGVAILRGSRQEALSNLLGVHSERNVMCVDEMQGTRDVVVDAIGNRLKSGRFKFLGMGNPTSREDPLGVVSEPIGGWKKLDINCESWKSKMGVRVEFFNGLKSPGIRDAVKYNHLITLEDIERKREIFGEGSLVWWSQVIGFMPPEGVGGYMFDRLMLEERGALMGLGEDEVWLGDVERVGGLDPAFSVGGDRAVLAYADVGKVKDGRTLIRYYRPIVLDLVGSGRAGDERGVAFRLRDEVVNRCFTLGIKAEHLAVDATGLQVSFCELLEEGLGGNVYRVNFSGAAIGKFRDGRDARDMYMNRASQVWGILGEYISSGMIRGLSNEVVVELCSRRVENVSGGRVKIESKEDMKKRVGYSPDLADAVALVSVLIRERMGIISNDELRKVRLSERDYMKGAIREGEYDERDEEAVAIEEAGDYSTRWLDMAGRGHWDIIT